MKFRKLLLAAGLTAVMVMAGCGQDSAEDTAAQETEQTEEVSTEETEQTEEAAESAPEDESTAEADSQTDAGDSQAENAGEEQTYEDNFAVDSEAVSAFADKIKEAVAAKDMEALADLTAFPVYVGIPDTEGIVETRDDFLALGADQVLTDELLESVASADMSGQEPSMAGFVVAGESGRPNIIFGVVDGRLAITGINY
ncbi:MAG: hypothetical protein ACOX8J_01050 [Candidatus Merdisoma sp.]|jgi:hypothetical protein